MSNSSNSIIYILRCSTDNCKESIKLSADSIGEFIQKSLNSGWFIGVLGTNYCPECYKGNINAIS